MPNSERTLRRLRRLGIVVAILGVFTIAQGIYFQDRTKDAQECVERKVDEFAVVLRDRADAGTQEAAAKAKESRARSLESAAVRQVLLNFNEAVRAGETTEAERQKVVDALADYDRDVVEVRAQLAEVREELKEVRKLRNESPVPEFPKGACDSR